MTIPQTWFCRNYGSSKADFIAKMHIALKEYAETETAKSSSSGAAFGGFVAYSAETVATMP